MDMKGEQLIPAPQADVWKALNDPAVLRACVPGCEAIDPVGPNEYMVLMVAKVGPVSAKFKGRLMLSDIKPPNSYSIAFDGQGGPAGFAKGGAQVALSTLGDQTRLAYDVKASVGGKLAQIGSRLIDAAAKKVADDFFNNFNRRFSGEPSGDETVIGTPKGAEGRPPHGSGRPRRADVSNPDRDFLLGSSLVVFVVALFVFWVELD
jgi:carbon monoxide dehydrogenase subunit G